MIGAATGGVVARTGRLVSPVWGSRTALERISTFDGAPDLSVNPPKRGGSPRQAGGNCAGLAPVLTGHVRARARPRLARSPPQERPPRVPRAGLTEARRRGRPFDWRGRPRLTSTADANWDGIMPPMRGLLESVPNFSTGRDPAAVAAIRAAVEAHARVLDVHSDPDHNRSVLTCVGEPDALVAGLAAGVAAAIERIDLTVHEGVHPRVGAADVVPLVRFRAGDARPELAARALGERIGRLGRAGDRLRRARRRPPPGVLPRGGARGSAGADRCGGRRAAVRAGDAARDRRRGAAGGAGAARGVQRRPAHGRRRRCTRRRRGGAGARRRPARRPGARPAAAAHRPRAGVDEPDRPRQAPRCTRWSPRSCGSRRHTASRWSGASWSA